MFAVTVIRAQEKNSPLDEYHRRIWTTEDGLPDGRAHSILQTSDGYLWIGTYGGLVRFDGLQFVVFNSANSPIPPNDGNISLTEDHDGFLWIGTRNGVFRYRNGSFENFTVQGGLWSMENSGLHMGDSGTLWILTPKGLNRWTDGLLSKVFSFRPLQTVPTRGVYDEISGIYEEDGKFLWLSNGSSVEKRDVQSGDTQIVHVHNERVRHQAIGRDRAGTMWVADESGLYQQRKDGWKHFNAPLPQSPPFYNFLFFDRSGNLWYSAARLGLVRFDGARFEVVNTDDGLPDNHVICMTEDAERNLWLSGGSAGVLQLRPRRITTIAKEDGLQNENVHAVCESRDGSLWIGTDAGLGRFSPSGQSLDFTNYTVENGLQINTVRSLCEDQQGRVWVGTEFGLDCFENGKFRSYPVPGEREKFECAVRVIYEDRSGTLWFGSKWGLHRLRDGIRRTYDQADGLSTNEVRVILERVPPESDTEKGVENDRTQPSEGLTQELWVGTRDGGLNHLIFSDDDDPPPRKLQSMARLKVFPVISLRHSSKIPMERFGSVRATA